MSRRSRRQLVAGLAVGVLLGALLRLLLVHRTPPCAPAADEHGGLLLVGVMTASQYVDSRAAAAVDTWGESLPDGRLLVFGGEGATSERELPLVALRGVDDRYPPQRKSFLMLLHMWERYGSQYSWFMRADDDVYVRGPELAKFLRALDSRRALFVGQAGRGVADERRALGLRAGDNFCMGGPGVLLSHETLRRVAPHLRSCLQRLRSRHEDVELGRCVAEHAGVTCTWSYDMQTIMHHNGSGAAAYSGRLKRREVHRAITLHPVKDHRHMYRLHSHFINLHVAELRERQLLLRRELRSLAGDRDRDEWAGEDGALVYEFISRAVYSHDHDNPKRRIETPLKEALDDLIREVMDIMNAPSRERGRVIEFTELLYGYRQRHPLLGVRSVLDLLLRYRRYRGRKLTAAVRRHAYVVQRFTGTEIRELDVGEEELVDYGTRAGLLPDVREAVHSLSRLMWGPRGRLLRLLLPLSGRLDQLRRFLRDYERVVLLGDEPGTLTVLLHLDERGDHARAIALLAELQARHPARPDAVRLTKLPDAEFSRGAALTRGLEDCAETDLVFFIDVDVEFTAEGLRAARAHAAHGRVYFPIVFSEYDPVVVESREFNAPPGESWSPSEREEERAGTVSAAEGHFRRYGFGLAAGEKRALLAAGGFDLKLRGWGLEDVRLYEALLRAPWPMVVRAPAPHLRHRHHPAACAPPGPSPVDEDGAAQLRMCAGSRASSFASERHLHTYLLNHLEYVEAKTSAV